MGVEAAWPITQLTHDGARRTASPTGCMKKNSPAATVSWLLSPDGQYRLLRKATQKERGKPIIINNVDSIYPTILVVSCPARQ